MGVKLSRRRLLRLPLHDATVLQIAIRYEPERKVDLTLDLEDFTPEGSAGLEEIGLSGGKARLRFRDCTYIWQELLELTCDWEQFDYIETRRLFHEDAKSVLKRPWGEWGMLASRGYRLQFMTGGYVTVFCRAVEAEPLGEQED